MGVFISRHPQPDGRLRVDVAYASDGARYTVWVEPRPDMNRAVAGYRVWLVGRVQATVERAEVAAVAAIERLPPNST